MTRKGMWIAAAGIVSAAIVAGTFAFRKPAPAVAAAPLAQKPAIRAVVAPGRVEPVSEEIRIGSELNGKLREVPVSEGERIRKGQTIAVLENGDYVARVARAEAVVAQREAAERRLVNGSRMEERREAEATVDEARAVLENAKADLNRRTELFRSGDISRADLDRHQREVSVAQARLEAAVQRRDLVERSTRDEDLASARADLAQARAELAEARALLEKTIIRAPLHGIVLRKHRRTGESITDQPGDPILTLADDSVLRVRVDVDEADVARVRVGQTAYITAEAYGERRFTGKVIRLGEILGRKNIRTDEPTERVDSKILETLVELNPGQRLPSGLRVDTYIETGEGSTR